MEHSANYLHALLDCMSEGVVVIDERGLIQKSNQAIESILGYTREDLVGKNVSLLMSEPDSSCYDGYLAHYQATGQTGILGKGRSVTARHRDGQEVPIHLELNKFHHGEQCFFVGVVQDLSHKKELNQKKQLYDTILNSTPLSIISTSADGLIQTFNKGAEEMLGYLAEDVINKLTPALIHDPDEIVARAHELSQELGESIQPGFDVFVAKARQGIPDEHEWSYLCKDGRRIPIRLSVTALQDVYGEVTGFLGIGWDISQLKQLERQQHENEQRLQQFLDALPVGVYVLNADGSPYYANKVAQQLLGDGVVPGPLETLSEVYPAYIEGTDIDYPLSETPIVKALNGESIMIRDIEIQLSGRRINLQAWGSPVYASSGEILYAISAFSDITQEKQAEIELRQEREKAESASRSKSTFLANMGHELRTPLNAIIGYSEMLRDESLIQSHPMMMEDLERIRNSGLHLLALINDILELSKIEAGKISTHSEIFSISELARQALSTTRLWAKKNDNQLELIDELLQNSYFSDALKIKQILLNLLSNACKFTHKGKVSLRLFHPEADPDGVCFEVNDTGIGIPIDKQGQLFHEFIQIDATTTRKYGGTGLGLALSRRLCELLGGEITLTSSEGQGSSFKVTLPGQTVENKGDTRPVKFRPVNRKLLVIDDDPLIHQMIRHFLQDQNWQVLQAESGDTGFKMALQETPAVILLDLLMPEMDGHEVLRQIRQTPALVGTLVLLVSSAPDYEVGYELGAEDILLKPLQREQLLGALTRLLPLEIRRRILIVEDDDTTRQLLRRMLAKEDWQISEAGNGEEALEILQTYKPDLILMDLMMPKVDGFDLLGALQASSETAELPVIVLTAKDISAKDETRLEGVVRSVFQKGAYSREQLVRNIADILSQYEREEKSYD